MEQNCSSILVLGAATFVGFHLSHYLAFHHDGNVMGLDNLHMCRNCDFDLKRDRAFQLYRLGIPFQDIDICEEQLALKRTEQNDITCVIHVVEDKQMTSELDTFEIQQVICFVKFVEELAALQVSADNPSYWSD